MIAKKVTYLIVMGAFAGCAYLGWKLTSRNAYESAEYTLLQREGSIELRQYPDLMLATTIMEIPSEGQGSSFQRLFRYISGGNENEQKVAMTTPVFMEPESGRAEGQMAFVIPKDVTDSLIPQPSNTQVRLKKRRGGRFAVIRFSGQLDETSYQEKHAELESWIEKQGLEFTDEFELAGYDPPWTPGPLRRNEIQIRIRDHNASPE